MRHILGGGRVPARFPRRPPGVCRLVVCWGFADMGTPPGLQADCEALLSRFQEKDSVRFEDFTEVWRSMKFGTIFWWVLVVRYSPPSRRVLTRRGKVHAHLPPASWPLGRVEKSRSQNALPRSVLGLLLCSGYALSGAISLVSVASSFRICISAWRLL